MSDVYKITRVVINYEKLFETDFEKVRNEKEYYINNLKEVIGHVDEALKLKSEMLDEWKKTLEELCKVDDANTLWKKLQLSIMMFYTNIMCGKFQRETQNLQSAKERLEKLLHRLIVLSVAF